MLRNLGFIIISLDVNAYHGKIIVGSLLNSSLSPEFFLASFLHLTLTFWTGAFIPYLDVGASAL